MFKRLILAVALCLAFAMPAAAADVNGFYVGAKFIDSIQNKWGSGELTGSVTQNTVGGGVFVGYDFYPQHQIPLRAEIEYAIRSNVNWSESMSFSDGVNSASAEAEAIWGLQTLMANFYFDFHNSTAFTPYIGAGAGVGFVNTEYKVSYYDTTGVSLDDSRSKTDTVFAWNVGAGCAYAFNDNISADLGYRYVGLGESSVKWAGENLKTQGNAHEFSLGLRFTF